MNTKLTITSALILLSLQLFGQSDLPYGTPHKDAPTELSDYAPLIGKSQCQSYSRNQDGTWQEPVAMTWTFRYIMDGMAVQDETIKEDGLHSGSIRQYHADSARWYVHYYSTTSPGSALPVWEGGKQDNEIVLYRDQTAPNGTPGFYKIRFFDITDEHFEWLGAWVNKDESFAWETWKISCKKESK